MNNILILLFSALDCGVWGVRQITSWADKTIVRLEQPGNWVLDLSLASSEAECRSVLDKEVRRLGVVFPDNIGDLMVGLVLYRLDDRAISAEMAKDLIADIVDSYGSSFFDVEGIVESNLEDPTFDRNRSIGLEVMRYLNSEELSEADRKTASVVLRS